MQKTMRMCIPFFVYNTFGLMQAKHWISVWTYVFFSDTVFYFNRYSNEIEKKLSFNFFLSLIFSFSSMNLNQRRYTLTVFIQINAHFFSSVLLVVSINFQSIFFGTDSLLLARSLFSMCQIQSNFSLSPSPKNRFLFVDEQKKMVRPIIEKYGMIKEKEKEK